MLTREFTNEMIAKVADFISKKYEGEVEILHLDKREGVFINLHNKKQFGAVKITDNIAYRFYGIFNEDMDFMFELIDVAKK